jgi:uncharacterized membrane protein (DUF373 family)
MRLKDEVAAARTQWATLTVYRKFEHVVVLVLTLVIAVVIVAALWNLVLKVLFGLVLTGTFDPTDYTIFQAVFGMIFTVIIALEFKKSLMVMAERHESVVQVRTVILIALLAVVRKLTRARAKSPTGLRQELVAPFGTKVKIQEGLSVDRTVLCDVPNLQASLFRVLRQRDVAGNQGVDHRTVRRLSPGGDQ